MSKANEDKNNADDEIIKVESALIQQETSLDKPDSKVLYVDSNTVGFDFWSLTADLSQSCSIANDIVKYIERAKAYIVQIPTQYQNGFDAGDYLLNENTKTGVMYPTLYRALENGKREFVCNLPIKQEYINSGNLERIATSFHNLQLQHQVRELNELMTETYLAVERIEKGQLDDRIGRLRAGQEQVLFALDLGKKERVAEIAKGRDNLLIAQKQFLQTFKRRVLSFNAIPAGRLKQVWYAMWRITKASDTWAAEFEEIQNYYALILQATQMIAFSWALSGRPDKAKRVYDSVIQDMKNIDFSSMQTLQNGSTSNNDLFYDHADEYVMTERDIFMNNIQKYDAIGAKMQGDKLLEVFQNGGT